MKRLLSMLALSFIYFSIFAQSECSLQSFAYEVVQTGDEFYFVIKEPSADQLLHNYIVIVNDEVYDSASVKVGPFLADCETNYTIQLNHRFLEFCQVSASIGTVCFDPNQCRIGDIEISYPECDTGFVMVDIDFKYENTSDSFFLRGNGNFYGEYAYSDLPIQVGPVDSNCSHEYEFIVIDAVNANCSSSIGGIVICCPDDCGQPLFEIVSQECSEDRLFMKLAILENQFITNSTVQINGDYVSDFRVDGHYLYLEHSLPLNAVLNTVTVCTVGIADVCCASQTFFTDGCTTDSLCHIYGLEYWVEDCQPGEEVFLNLNFSHDAMHTDSFKVNGNGIFYGEFSYRDLPIKIGPFESSCDQVYELEIKDSVNPECSEAIEDVIICCGNGCLEPIFEIVDLSCGDAEARIKLKLIHPLHSDFLSITINDDSLLVYELDYPYVYIQFPINSVDEYFLELCTNSINSTCCYAQSFDLSNCNTGECKIGFLSAEASDCIDTDLPSFKLDFEYENVGSEGFSVKGNGVEYGNFKYEELPIFIYVEDNCDFFYEFIVTDNEFECSAAIEAGPYCCNSQCSFRAREFRTKCDDGILSEVAFFLEEETDPIKQYEVFVNGQIIGRTEENNVFLEFATQIPLDGTNSVNLTICDSDCCVEYSLDVSQCVDPPVECSIEGVTLDHVSCGDGGLNFTLDFKHEGSNSEYFDVFSVFGFFGTYKYDELPLDIKSFPNVNLGLNVLFICDKGSFCCQAHLFNSPFCQGLDGNEISNVKDLFPSDFNYLVRNPVDYEIELKSPVQKNIYKIFDSSGQSLMNHKSSEHITTLDVSNFKAGLYIIRIENEMGLKIEKLIIAK